MHVQSCCFANLNLFLFCRSRYRRRRRCLHSLLMEGRRGSIPWRFWRAGSVWRCPLPFWPSFPCSFPLSFVFVCYLLFLFFPSFVPLIFMALGHCTTFIPPKYTQKSLPFSFCKALTPSPRIQLQKKVYNSEIEWGGIIVMKFLRTRIRSVVKPK